MKHCIFAIVGLLAIGQAAAHHSTALFVVRVINFEGEIIEVDWRNPHVFLTVVAKVDDGPPETLLIMADNIKNLEHVGIRHEMFKLGKTVNISGRRSGREEHKILGQSIVFANGSKFRLWFGS